MKFSRTRRFSPAASLLAIVSILLAFWTPAGRSIVQAQGTQIPIILSGLSATNGSVTPCQSPDALAATSTTFYFEYPLSAMCVSGISSSDPLSQITYMEPNNLGTFNLLSGNGVKVLLNGQGNYLIPIPTLSNAAEPAGVWTFTLLTSSGVTYNIPYTLATAPATGSAPQIGSRCAGSGSLLTLAGFLPNQSVQMVLVGIPQSYDPKITHKSTVEAAVPPGKTVNLTVIDQFTVTTDSNGMYFHSTSYALNYHQSFYFAVYTNSTFPSGTFENNPFIARYAACSISG